MGVPISEQATDNRLGPAEAHKIVRQKLGRLARRWRLSPADVHRLARQMQTSTYAPGEVILPRGVRAGCLGLIVRGQVAVHIGQRASTRLVVVLLPGSTFGEMMLAEGRPSNVTLQALSETEIRFLRRSDLLASRTTYRSKLQAVRLQPLLRLGAASLLLLIIALVLLALPAVRQVVALAPMGLGQWCWEREHVACTRHAWQAAASLAPEVPGPLLAVGTFYFEQGETAAAERAFRAAGELAPDLPEVHNNMGLIYARQGDHERAIDQFARALELEPGVAAVEHNLADSLQAMNRYEQAMEHYRVALALGEPRVDTLLNLALACYQAGEFEQAKVAAEQAISHDGELPVAHTLLAAVALEFQRPETALAELEQAIYLDSNYEQAHFYMGLAYKALAEREAAAASFERALAYADDDVTRARIQRHLDELHSRQGGEEGGGPD